MLKCFWVTIFCLGVAIWYRGRFPSMRTVVRSRAVTFDPPSHSCLSSQKFKEDQRRKQKPRNKKKKYFQMYTFWRKTFPMYSFRICPLCLCLKICYIKRRRMMFENKYLSGTNPLQTNKLFLSLSNFFTLLTLLSYTSGYMQQWIN